MTERRQSIQLCLFVFFCLYFTCNEKPFFCVFVFASVQTQSPVLQGKMLVPMATVRTAPAPAPQFPIVAPPLPVQNGAQTGSKVRQHFRHITYTMQNIFPTSFFLSLCWFHGSCCPLLIQIIQIAPMPVVQPQLPQGGAVHPASAFPVTMGTAAVVAPGSAPSQAVLLPPAHTRYKVNWYSVFALFIFATFFFFTGTAQ